MLPLLSLLSLPNRNTNYPKHFKQHMMNLGYKPNFYLTSTNNCNLRTPWTLLSLETSIFQKQGSSFHQTTVKRHSRYTSSKASGRWPALGDWKSPPAQPPDRLAVLTDFRCQGARVCGSVKENSCEMPVSRTSVGTGSSWQSYLIYFSPQEL